MMAFHGVLLCIAMLRKVTLPDVFSRRCVNSCEFAKRVFTRKRFYQIFWGLHVSPPPNVNSDAMANRRSKVRQVLDYVSERFLKYYRPGANLSADESMVAYKGRIAHKMYCPMKPKKWGMRVYDIACSRTGYILALIPYYGTATTEILGNPQHKFNTRIILELLDRVRSVTEDNGYHLFTDRLYTNLELAKELLNRRTHLTGTIQTNRIGLPPQIKKGKVRLQSGEHVSYCKSNRYHVLSWRDKRYVTMCSTFYSAATKRVPRNTKGNNNEEITKPEMICEYTANMGGIDRADHYCSSYAFIQKSLKWWRKMYFFVLEVAIVNSFILYNMHMEAENKKQLRHRDYRKKLCEELVSGIRNKNYVKKFHVNESDANERLNGLLHVIKSAPNKRYRDCIVCSDRSRPGGRKQTVYCCITCPGKPAMHPDCFEAYHTEVDYKVRTS